MTDKVCECPKGLQRPRVVGVMRAVCENCDGEIRAKKAEASGAESVTMPPSNKAEIDKIERKLLAARALIDEGLNRIRELKA